MTELMKPRMNLYWRLIDLPELGHLTEKEKRRILRQSFSRWYRIILYGRIAGVAIIFGIIVSVTLTSLLNVPGSIGFIFFVTFAALTAFALYQFWLIGVRGQIQREFITLLRGARLPVCLHCGYNLTNITQDACPECGAGIRVRTESETLTIANNTSKEKSMADRSDLVTFKGSPITLTGEPIAVGDAAPDFTAVGTDLSDVKLSDQKGKVVILSAVPSLDTGICDLQTKRFNQEASKHSDWVVLTISADLPFAQKRWCGAAEAEAVVCVSDFRERTFGKTYGLEIADGPLATLIARSVMVIDREGKIVYQEIVPEIAQEPNYDAALEAAESAA